MNEAKKSGRKLKYGEKTVLMRVPASMVPQVEAMMTKREVIADIATYPPLIESVVQIIGRIMNDHAEACQNMTIEQIKILSQYAHVDARPKLQALMETYIESLPDSDREETAYTNIVRSVFDSVGQLAKPDLRLI
jgi:hypothetical protein